MKLLDLEIICFGQLAKLRTNKVYGSYARLLGRYSNISHCSALREPGDACHARTRNLKKRIADDEKNNTIILGDACYAYAQIYGRDVK